MTRPFQGELLQIWRFLLLGAVNSLLSLLLYVLLQRVLPIPLAYGLCYVGGIALTALLSGRVVFRVSTSRAQRVRAFLGYLTVFLIGLTVVHALQDGLGFSALTSGAGSILVTAPLNYAVGRRLFDDRA